MSTAPGSETISVLLCTYEGAPFVGRQLDGILGQTRPLDELVVCDDRSQDGTLDVVRQQAAALGDQLVTIANARQFGPARNFAQAIGLATGSLLVFADQDDEWEPDRLAVIEATFAGDSSIAAVFHDGSLIDALGSPVPGSLWRAHGMGAGRRRDRMRADPFRELLRGNVVTGATLAMRTTARSVVLPIPEVGMHDEWIGLLTAARGSLRAVDQPLIRYRVHGANAVGVPSTQSRARVRARRADPGARGNELVVFSEARERLGADVGSPEVIGLLDAKIRFLRQRSQLSTSALARIPSVLCGLVTGRYHRFAHGSRSALHDIIDGS